MDDDNDGVDIEIEFADGGKSWTGRSEGPDATLDAAFKDAWEKAKEGKGPEGTYDVQIKIEAKNPIHAYIVIITPNP
jgi:hypothetical protein